MINFLKKIFDKKHKEDSSFNFTITVNGETFTHADKEELSKILQAFSESLKTKTEDLSEN